MRTTVDCVPCYIKQVISTLRTAGVKEEEQHSIINALFPTIAQLDPLKHLLKILPLFSLKPIA